MTPSGPSRIYLIGMMGVGKTTIGKRLASLLGYAFVDLDLLIEKQEGKMISEIFSESGESHFRKLESEMLRGITGEKTVVATGGGTPCYHDNISYINKSGISIYLRAKAGLIYQRISRYPNKRPMLRGMRDEEIRTFIQQKLEEREPVYMRSNHVFDVPAVSAETIVESGIFGGMQG